MRQINLTEYQESNPITLEVDERDVLKDLLSSVSIEPVKHTSNKYRLRPGSIVGALEMDGLSVLIKPKIGMPQLLSLACYALGIYKQQDKEFSFAKDEALPDVLALALIAAARRAFGRGLLRGYLSEEDALHTVRGRIRFEDQIRRRYGIPLPVELRFDEFTEDILANQLVKAAAARLRRMTLRSSEARRGLGWIAAILENVSLLEFRRRNVPEIRFDRLNEHYRHVVGLARLILLHSEFESFRGDVRASGFLIDMNALFQEFVTQALRKTLEVSADTLRAEKKIHLAVGKEITMYPDLTWWDGDNCTFVGDAKYKKVDDRSVPNVDLYQVLAYATALDLPGGILVYAKGETDPATYTVRYAGKRLEVFSLDLAGSLDQVLARVKTLACRIESMRAEALHFRASKNIIATPPTVAQYSSPTTQQRIPA
ncbi:MAG: restriction endonuclease [Caldilineaceae bacterium SB0665_bin_25]|nr:restriction endonuclease [Caldilineaceae bacterium SB0665_bin_25]